MQNHLPYSCHIDVFLKVILLKNIISRLIFIGTYTYFDKQKNKRILVYFCIFGAKIKRGILLLFFIYLPNNMVFDNLA